MTPGNTIHVPTIYKINLLIITIAANQWLEQTTFVHPLYPENCTDDLEHRRGPHSGKY